MTQQLSTPTSAPVLAVRDLAVAFPSETGRVDAVRGLSFDLMPGRTLGIVGESGSGKSVSSMAIMGLLPESAKVTGSVRLAGKEILGLSDREMSAHRGVDIGMVFQDPLSALTPVFTVGDQIVEALRVHQDIDRARAWERAVELLDLVGIPNPRRRAKAFPHEFSGGMRQRVVIALAIANDPRIIIADEPTTALDVTIQAQILEVLKTAQRETDAAVILITHDMGVVANAADDVVVMYAGRPVEQASVHELFGAPRMPYTIGLLAAVPRPDRKKDAPLVPIEGNPPVLIDLPPGCPFRPRCPVAVEQCGVQEPDLVQVSAGTEGDGVHAAACVRAREIDDGLIDGEPLFAPPPPPEDIMEGVARSERDVVLRAEGLSKQFPLMKGTVLKRRVGTVYAVSDVSFELRRGETLSIVGESGSGKTTTLLEIMDLGASSTSGVLELGGRDVTAMSRTERRRARRGIQMVFQDPMGALDPRLTIYDIIAEPLRAFGYDGDLEARVDELMRLVGLDPTQAVRFPGNFSGGQRQRIGLARALASKPDVIVLDEPVSALDVSIQAGMINLLDELRARLGVSYVFVAHDLSVVRHISTHVAVMYLGRFVESGQVGEVFDNPAHPYTRALLSAIPVPDPVVERAREHIVLEGDLPSPTEEVVGCAFAQRCPVLRTLDEPDRRRCREERPRARVLRPGHEVACHWAERSLPEPRSRQ
ncbi:dipeptide ABC transporter ATP-binding protein [Actinomyces howellii]|uniref:Glutathione import ATP-binding protein GsiA n=1 Tax=Actinomyces howellii TaxID=52771 RepID=A0A3S5EH67_9ACTO|nr:ABC transporter ATP-binding protein [Actinomyces howellii]VEG29791.1 Glutathione import ATP-binding protein GsiA [Actinomyces howellii]